MFNAIDTPRPTVSVEAFRPTVVNAGQYEGKDNPGGGMYFRTRQEKKEEPKRERPKSNGKIDLIA